MENNNEVNNVGINNEIIKGDKYIRFYKNHLANKALEKLREVTGNQDLNYKDTILNEFGKEINVKDEIKEYVEVFGNEIIEDLASIDNKIDEWFFEYKVNEKQLKLIEEREINNAIDNNIIDLEKSTLIEENNIEKSILKVEKAEKQLNSIEEKCVKKLENNTKLDSFTKKHLIDSFKSKIRELKNNLSNILEKLNIVKKDSKNQEMTLNNNMKLELLSIEKLSHKTLDDLAKDDNISILRKVASHSNTSEKTLIYIANKVDDYKVKENLLNNENTTSLIIDKYLKEEDKDIVIKALLHKNVSIESLEKFSKIDDIEIQSAVLNNENCSLKAFQNIAKNNENLDVLYNDYKVKESLLNNENVPGFLINNLLKDEDINISIKALSHKNVSVENLEKFSVIDDVEIQKAILNNENCSLKALENIANNTRNKDILSEVIKHKNCIEELKENVNKESDKKVKLTLQEKLNNKKIEAEKINKSLDKDKIKEVSKAR